MRGHIRAFLLGVYEFRRAVTTHFDDDLIETYDTGREWAHRITLRRYDADHPSRDWCSHCEKVRRWDGEFCRSCRYEWGVG